MTWLRVEAMTPTDTAPAARSVVVVCGRCHDRVADERAARGVARRLLALLVAKEEQLDAARREVAHLEAQIARARPSPAPARAAGRPGDSVNRQELPAIGSVVLVGAFLGTCVVLGMLAGGVVVLGRWWR